MLNYNEVDWPLLSQQKLGLLKIIDNLPTKSQATGQLNGILSLIDSIQDDAVDNEGFSSKVVFPSLTEDNDETTT